MDIARAHWKKVAILAIPFLVALTNGTWLTSAMGDADSWAYNGYFRLLRAFATSRAAWGPPAYNETRLPIIVPGALVYASFSDGVARLVLNLCILHGIVALSFWYVVRTHVSRTAATAAAALLVTDVFYLRSIGWDYVDNALLAYQALTFALLTRLPSTNRPRLCSAAAGFTATSMLAVHLASGVMLPVLAIYALVVTSPFRSWSELLTRAKRLASWAAVGGAACLLLHGLVSKFFLGGPFFFFMEQLREAQLVDRAHYAAPLRILTYGNWLAIHAAVFVSSIAALAIARIGGTYPNLSRFVRFCLWTPPLLYLAIIAGDLLHWTFYMARSGLYATNFLLLVYMTVAALLFARRDTKPWIACLPLLLCPCVLIVKLALHDGLGLTLRFPQPMYAVAIAMAIAIVIGFAIERTTVLVGVIVALALCSLLVPYHFVRDDRIVEARRYMLTNGAPPRVFYSEADPERLAFVSIASAFTDHVVRDHYRGSRPIARGEPVVILDSSFVGDEEHTSPCTIAGLVPIGSRVLTGRYFDMHVHLFTAQDGMPKERVRCPSRGDHAPGFTPLRRLLASTLPGRIGRTSGDTRIAQQGSDAQGFLTEGSGVALTEGVYRVTFHYAAKSDWQTWDLVATIGGEPRQIAESLLPDTAGRPNTLSIALRLPEAVSDFRARTWFAGSGELTVEAITIDRRDAAGSR